jgi:RNA polymerase sigma-70 factor (ECF subfamily)
VYAERPSFASVAEEHLDDVHAYLVYLTGDRTVAEDLTAETFERALRMWRRYDPRRAGAKTWLCQVARSTALDHFRSEERRRRREERYAARESQEVSEPTLGGGLSAELERALLELSPGEREVVVLRIVLELDGETSGRVLGISPTACSTRLSRTLQKLEEKVRPNALA